MHSDRDHWHGHVRKESETLIHKRVQYISKECEPRELYIYMYNFFSEEHLLNTLS